MRSSSPPEALDPIASDNSHKERDQRRKVPRSWQDAPPARITTAARSIMMSQQESQGGDMEPIGVGKRAVAVLVDWILLGIVGYLIAAASGSTSAAGFNLAG